jgi:hypothetical protein
MKLNRAPILIFALAIVSGPAHGGTVGCRFVPAQALAYADKVINRIYFSSPRKNSSSSIMPDNVPINTEFVGEISKNSDKGYQNSQYEALLRPRKTGFFHLLHVVLFKLDRSRNFLYVCMNHNSKRPQDSHLTIYFMAANGFEKPRSEKMSFLPNAFNWQGAGLFDSATGSGAKIAGLPVILTPVHFVTNDALNLLDYIPLIGEAFRIPSGIVKWTGEMINRINEKLGLGVERIVIKSHVIEFANYVDLKNPERANILYRWRRQ